MSTMNGRLIQMPVPPVRPILRRTIKRFLRMLPSVLLLLFVISLIFVTLMQIAVIHTHRRTLAFQRSANSGSITQFGANLSSTHYVSFDTTVTPSSVSTLPIISPKVMIKKTEVLRIEALLDKSLPSVEANSKLLQNLINSGRIKQIISLVSRNHKIAFSRDNSTDTSSITDSANPSLPFDILGNINDSYSLIRLSTGMSTLNDSNDSEFLINNNDLLINKSMINLLKLKHLFIGSNSSSPKFNHQLHLIKAKPLCPSVPPKLIGRIRIETHPRVGNNMSEILRKNSELRSGGHWEPTHCYARHRVAVIIPYRDRKEHLAILLYHLHPILQRQLLSYKIYVVEQYGNETFNKGVLMNAGVIEALKEMDYHCFVFHDVDLIPEDDRNLYSCPFSPRHMSVAVDKFNYTLPYKGEDDDMAHRLKYHNLQIIRPPDSVGRYTMIKHHHRPESPNNVRSALLRMAKRRASRDGLGSVRIRLQKYVILNLDDDSRALVKTIVSKKIFNYSYRMMVINTRSLCSLQTYVDNIVKRDFISRQNEKEANQLCDGYYLANRETKEALLRYIASRYCVSKTHAMSTVNNFLESKDRQEDYNGLMAIDKLRDSLTPRYLTLIDQIGRLEDGVKFLVDIRSDLINIISDSPLDKSAKIELRSLSNHIKELLSLWFSVGFLSLERMTWNSPSSMLQKLSDYEAVHPMRNWIDLKRRVGPYRRCYVFTHSCLPREPLVILHVALMQSIATSIQNIIQRTQSESLSHHDEETLASLDLYAVKKEDPNQINAAIFYSISSTQRGLHGIELGNQLIKRVVREIRSEFPQITQFSSLSPIPNFNEYLFLELQLMQKGEKEPLFTPDEFFCLKKHLIGKDHHDSELWSILLRQLKSNSWIHDDKLIELLRAPLMRKCAHYLYAEKRRGFALNSVAHFHLRNGAVLWRLNWLADVTPRGLTNSCGMMVNYRYFLENTENNSHLYTEDRFVVASEQLLNLIKPYTSAL